MANWPECLLWDELARRHLHVDVDLLTHPGQDKHQAVDGEAIEPRIANA
jgi:hypothetical protein